MASFLVSFNLAAWTCLPVKMLCRISLVFAVIAFHSREAAEAAPVVVNAMQYMEPVAGFIPVYIRQGDTPLEEINMQLAEAFRSYDQKHGMLPGVRGRARNVLTTDEKWLDEGTWKQPEKKEEDDASLGLDEFDLDDGSDSLTFPDSPKLSQHIQKIKPKPRAQQT